MNPTKKIHTGLDKEGKADVVNKTPSTKQKESKITKYFEVSPQPKNNKGTVASNDSKSNDDSNLANDDKEPYPLPSSLITPENTPVKNKERTGKGSADTTTSSTDLEEIFGVLCSNVQLTPPKCPKSDSADDLARHAKEYGCKEDMEEKQEDKKKKKKSRKGKKDKNEKQNKSQKEKKEQEQSPFTKRLTDYFPVRRSSRKCKSLIEAEQKQRLEDAILTGKEEGIEVQDIPGKGRGVLATRPFKRGEFVVEYYGDRISIETAKDREAEYAKDPSIGCYMYYFEFKNHKHCIDATKESGRLGRLLNHSKSGNCCTKLISLKGKPYLILVAQKDISIGEELVYDYGDRSKDTLQFHPWLAS